MAKDYIPAGEKYFRVCRLKKWATATSAVSSYSTPLLIRECSVRFTKIVRRAGKEPLDAMIHFDAGRRQRAKFIEQNRIELRSFVPSAFESRHPYPIAQENMVQHSVDAAERTRALFPVLRSVESRTF